MSDVLVIGSLNMDITVYVDRFPQIGETVLGCGMMMSPGGKGSNQALAISRLGTNVSMAGCVGSDVYGAELLQGLEKNAVDTSYIRRLNGIDTGMALITVSDGSNMIIVNAGANGCIHAGDILLLEEMISQAKALVLQLEIPQDAVEQAIQLAKKYNCTVFLNPAPYRDFDKKLLENVDYLIPNETEAGALLKWEHLDADNLEEALKIMQSWGVRTPIITLGEQGAAFMDQGIFRLVPPYPVQVVDSTAAGDTFIGGLVSAVVRGEKLWNAVDFAQRAAAYCVMHKGAHTAIPTAANIMDMALNQK